MRVLVTGGSGFIGQHVVSELWSRGHGTIQSDRRVEAQVCSHTVLADVTNRSDMLAACEGADGVIHLAGLLGTQEMIQNPFPAVETNVIGALNVFEAVATHGLPCVITGLGNHWMNNTYSITKSAVERFAAMYNKERGTRINIARAMNAYGPGQKAPRPYGSSSVRKIVPTFICKALRNEPIEVYGDGHHVSDMVYVTDLAAVLVKLLEDAAAGNLHPVVEVGPIQHSTVLEIASLIKELTFSQSKIVHLPMRPGEEENADVMADLRMLRTIGFDPETFVPLRQGMMETIDYYQQRLRSAA